MRGLKPAGRGAGGAIPRAFKSHRTREGACYRRYCESIISQFGPLPAAAATALREAGRLAVELDAIGHDLEAARGRNRRRDVARLRRLSIPMRTQLLNLERRLEELGLQHKRQSIPDAWKAGAHSQEPQR